MSFAFSAQADPPRQDCEALSRLTPANPFCTFDYAQARRAQGTALWLLGVRSAEQFEGGCLGFTTAGLLSRSLEIPSLPEVSEKPAFWEGLFKFCRDQRIARLVADSFASNRVRIPSRQEEVWRRCRKEFVVDLAGATPLKLPSNHQRNIKRARTSGVEISQSTGPEACREHARLVMTSLERRRMRGEKVVRLEAEDVTPFTRSGAAEIFQAILEGRVVSSLLVLMAPKGAYYQSAGTSPEGMACGASHFLVYETALRLQAMGLEVFNLGGAHEAGLQRFKSGFATREVALEAAEFVMESKVASRARGAARFLRRLMP